MGLCFQSITGGFVPEGAENVFNMDKPAFKWLVGRRDPVPRKDGMGHDWHIQGLADTEDLAVQMCADETYFIGPLPLNVALPHHRIDWPGHYFPLLARPHQIEE